MKAVMLKQPNKNSNFSPAIMLEIVSLVISMQIHCMSGQGLEINLFAKKHRSLEKMPQSITNLIWASEAPINTSHSKIRTY